MLLLAFAGYHLWLSSRIKGRLTAVRVLKEPVTLKELNNYYVEVPAASNAAVPFEKAFNLLQKNVAPKFLETLNDLPSGSAPLPVQLRETMEKACQENADALTALDEGAKLRACRYPVDYTSGWATLLPHLKHLQKCSALEMCHGALCEQKNDIPGGIAATETIMQLAASLDSEPDLISAVIQNKLYSHASELLRWMLNHRQLSREQLAKLQEIFAGEEGTNRLDRAILGKRCMILATFDYSAREILNAIDPGYKDPWAARLGIHVLRIYGALKKDELRCFDRVEECRQTLHLSLPLRLDRAAELRLAMNQEAKSKKIILTGVLLSMFLKGIERDAVSIAQRRLVRTALALEQFRTAQGALPSSLSELSPTFLSQVPMDPFGDEAIRYHNQDNGYVLYSIGPDRKDDEATKQIPRDPKIEQPHGDIIFSVSRK
jgi:hypothetical protein